MTMHWTEFIQRNAAQMYRQGFLRRREGNADDAQNVVFTKLPLL
jgi:hypothetical protein